MRRDVRWMYRGGVDGSITEEDWAGVSSHQLLHFLLPQRPSFFASPRRLRVGGNA